MLRVQILTLVCLAFYTGITYLTLRVTRNALNHAIKSSEDAAKDTKAALATSSDYTNAARQTADVAIGALGEIKKSTDLAKQQLIAAHRAYVFGYGVFGQVIDHPGGGQTIRLRVGLENSGNTPTQNMTLWTNWQFRNDELPRGFAFPDMDASGNILTNPPAIPILLPPKQRVGSTVFRDLTTDGVQAIHEGKIHLYAWGWVRYHDTFPDTVRHITKYCYRVSRVSPTVAADHCRENNCHDDECDKAGSQQAR